MTAWVKVPDYVVARMGALFSYYGKTGAPATALTDLPPVLVRGIIEYLSEDLVCDHSVNICCCDEQEVVRDLTLALQGKRVCTACHGEGFTDDEDGRPETCRRCFTSGVVEVEPAEVSA